MASSIAQEQYEAELAEQRARDQRKRQAMKEVAQRKQQMLAKLPSWVKPAQLVADIVTAVSFLVTLVTGGLEPIDTVTFIVFGNGQLLLSALVNWWPMKRWKKMAIIIMDLAVFMVLLVVFGTLGFFISQPAEACGIFGEAVGGPILGALGKGVCSVVGGVLEFVGT